MQRLHTTPPPSPPLPPSMPPKCRSPRQCALRPPAGGYRCSNLKKEASVALSRVPV